MRRILFALLLVGCGRHAGKTELPVNVQTVRPHRGEIVRSVTLPGNVRAIQEATLYAKVAGYLKTINVDKGDAVKESDTLAEIEAPEMLADLARVKAEANAAETEFKRTSDAQQKAPDLITPLALDTAKAKHEMAQANLRRLTELLAYAKITAPFTGIVTKRFVDPGAYIPAGGVALVRLMDFSKVRVDVWMPEREAPLVVNDLPVTVTVEELPGKTFDGKITRYAYALDDATKTMATEIEIANPDLALRPGMYASVKIALQRKPDALLIPAEALVSEKGKASVFTVAAGKAEKLAVRTGFDDAINVEVLDGLAADQPVILAGKQLVSDGQAVEAK